MKKANYRKHYKPKTEKFFELSYDAQVNCERLNYRAAYDPKKADRLVTRHSDINEYYTASYRI